MIRLLFSLARDTTALSLVLLVGGWAAGAETPLPPGVVARLGSPRFKNGERATCLAFSPDGKTLASGGEDGVVRLWDATGGEQRSVSPPLRSPIYSLGFRPDGEVLAVTTCGGGIYLLDAVKGVVIRSKKRPMRGGLSPFVIAPAVFAPDGKTLATPDGGQHGLVLWDAVTLREIRLIARDMEDVSQILFTPSGERLVTWETNNRICIWDATFWKRGRSRRLPKMFARHRLRRPAKNASAEAMSVPSPLRTLENKDGCIFGVVISRDGKQIVTAGGTLEKPSELGSPWKETALRVWNAATGEQTRVLKHASLHDGISGVALSVDGRTFAVASEKQLYFWDIKEGKFLRTLPAPGGGRETIGAFQFSPDGKRLAAGVGNAICLWDTASGRLLSPEGEEPIADLASVAVSGDGLLLAAGRKDGRIELWHLPTQRLLRHWAGHSEAVGGLAFAPNLKTLASRSRTGVIRLWDLTSGRRQREIKQGKKEGAGTAWLSYTRDGNRLACDYQSEGIIGIRFWDPVRGREMENIKTTVDPQEWLFAVTLSKDDRHLQALTTFGNLQHWRREDGRFGKPTVRPIQLSDPLFSPFSWSIAFAKDGTLATVDSSRRRIEIWGPSRRIGIGSGEVPTDPLRDLAFSPSDSYLVLLSQAGVHDLRALLNVVPEAYTLRMYEIASRREVLFRALPLAVGIRCYAFTPDGRRLITGMADTTILVWDLFACDSAKVDDLPALWADMKQEDGRRAHRALSALIAAGDKAVAFLDRPLQSIEGPKAEQLVRWVGDLDSDQFAVREQAEKRLAMAGELARGALERALASRPALEQRRRIDALLAELDDAVPDGETLRRLRAIVVLEYIGTPAARRLLRRLCDGAREARLSHEAKMALQRMTGGATRE